MPGAFDAVADGHVVPLSVGANTVTVTVAAEDRTATAAYVVTVTRAANTAPAFAAGPVSRPLAENSPGGTALGAAVTATDADQGHKLTYSLHGADGSAFAIDASSGQISTASGHDYDFETKSQYQFSVVATDDGSPPMSATAQVTVTLSNVAEVPAVPVPQRSAAARDSITVTWAVPAAGGGPPVSSYDVRYRATGSAVWRDGPQDLSVTRATVGSLEVDTEYEIAVRATNDDGDSGWTDPPLRVSTQRSADALLGGLSLSGAVLVPAFAADVLTYAATVPNTTAAVTVTASAADDNATVATVPGAFDAVADGHVVPLSVGANTITVTVTAEDHTATAAYVVTVTRAANTAPGFAAGPVSRPLAENSPGGTALGAAVTATDADQGQKLTYSLHGADESAFAIDASSGQISTASGHDYDFETKSQYQFSVVATDDGSPPMSATAQVTVTLSNVAEVPAVPVPQRSAAARDSITVTWAVPAAGGGPPVSSYDVRYRATGSAVWRDGPQDLSVTRATVGSLEVDTEYEIAVRATNDDGDSGWTDPPLRVSTQRSADALLGGLSLSGAVLVPAFAADVLTYAATVPNTTAAVTVTASAADDNATVATVPGAFDAVADGHVVPLSVGANTITVTVTAEDHTATAAYVVTVTRAANTAPGFAAGPVSRPLAENSPGGTALGAAVTATDADQGQKLTYSLHGADESAFAIDASSGQISTASGHDYDIETKSQYQFSVVATDDGSPPMSATAQVTVTLSNVAEVPAVPVPRRRAAARDSITVTWEVPAVGGGPPVSSYDVRYRATGSAVWLDGPQDLTVTRATVGSLDVDTEYEIAVRATNDDGNSGWTDPPLRVSTQRSADALLGGLSLSGTVLVPAFAADVLTYAATVPNTTAAVTVTASAADDNATVATVPGAFDAVADGHVVPLSVGANTITVTVTAEDHTATAAYVVTVTRAANTAPGFAAGPVSRPLAENSPGGTALGAAVTATDADQGQKLTYSLHGADESAFAIDASSGQISTASGHDYDIETKSQYQFSVVATDDGSPPMSATAQVTVTLSNVAEVPAVPEPRRSAAARDSITVTWAVPAVGGGPPVSSYDVRYRATGSAVWRDGPQDLSVTRATVGSLEVDTEYEIAVRAANDDGNSGWTDPPLRVSTQRSADALLGGLSLSGAVLVPAFAADVLTYAATVPNTTAAVTVTASAADDNATVATVPGAFDAVADGHVVPLSVGANTITVTVTAEDRTATAAYVRDRDTPPRDGRADLDLGADRRRRAGAELRRAARRRLGARRCGVLGANR